VTHVSPDADLSLEHKDDEREPTDYRVERLIHDDPDKALAFLNLGFALKRYTGL